MAQVLWGCVSGSVCQVAWHHLYRSCTCFTPIELELTEKLTEKKEVIDDLFSKDFVDFEQSSRKGNGKTYKYMVKGSSPM